LPRHARYLLSTYPFAGWILSRLPSHTRADLESAILHFREARRVAPSDPIPLANLADTLVVPGRVDEAFAVVSAESETLNLAAGAHNWLGWHYMTTKCDLARARDHLHEATRRAPEWNVAWLNLARACEAMGDEPGARAAKERLRRSLTGSARAPLARPSPTRTAGAGSTS
jgi:Flp pilus assembly protein TadD